MASALAGGRVAKEEPSEGGEKLNGFFTPSKHAISQTYLMPSREYLRLFSSCQSHVGGGAEEGIK